MLYVGGGSGLLAVIALIFVLRRRSGNELTEAKKMPSIDDLPRTGPPKSERSKTGPPPSSKPKKGPPPKPKPVEAEVQPVANVEDAMAKLSLETLPGKPDAQPQSVANYESLPGGGEYEYLSEGTFYSGEGIGRWKLEDDGSFTKVE